MLTNVGGGLVVDGELIVSGGETTMLFEAAEAALHGVAVLVRHRVRRQGLGERDHELHP